MVSTGPKVDNRGGARPGAGRPKETLSAHQVREMLKEAEERAKTEGKTLNTVLLDFVYDPELAAKDRIACIKLWKELTMAKISEGGETDQALGPAVFLPEQRPQLSIISGGKSE